MTKLTFSRTATLIAVMAPCVLLTACSPRFDWREAHDDAAPYTVLMPDKPIQLSREIQIGQHKTTMHMTATQIDHIQFAVGAAKMANATEAQLSIAAIKDTLLLNISGQIKRDNTAVSTMQGVLTVNDEFEASGGKPPTRMVGRLVARETWVYQILVVGPGEELDQPLNREAVDTFLTSFKPL